MACRTSCGLWACRASSACGRTLCTSSVAALSRCWNHEAGSNPQANGVLDTGYRVLRPGSRTHGGISPGMVLSFRYRGPSVHCRDNAPVIEICGHLIGGDPERPCAKATHTGHIHQDVAQMANRREKERVKYGVSAASGIVYFLGEWDTPFIKIGRRKLSAVEGLKGRIKDLQSGNPRTLYPLHTIWSTDVARDERAIHELFREFRVSPDSEWFRCNTDFTNWLTDNWNKV